MIRPHNHFFLPTASCQLLLLLLLLLAPRAVAAQSPELVQAKAQLQELNKQLDRLDGTIARELETALAGQVDTRPKGEFETTAEYQARLAAAKEAHERLAPEYERKKADRRRFILEKIEALTSQPFAAPIRIRLGTYDADSQTFPFFVRATGDSGTIEIPRAAAREVKTNLGTLKQTGYWQLQQNGIERLGAVTVAHGAGTYIGEVSSERRVIVVPKMTLRGHSDLVRSISFSPDGQILASGGDDQTINLWKTVDGEILRTIATGAPVWSISFSPDGQTLASGGSDGIIKLYRVNDGAFIKKFRSHVLPIVSIAFSSDGHTLTIQSNAGPIKTWQIGKGQKGQIETIERTGRISSMAMNPKSPAGAHTVVIGPNGEIFASSHYGGAIKLWNIDNGKLLGTLEGQGNKFSPLVFSADGKTLASGSLNSTIKLWQIQVVNARGKKILTAIRSGAAPGAGGKGPALPPALSAAVTFSEPSGDNLLAANEEGALEVTLTNSGQGAAYGVEVALRLTLREPSTTLREPQGDVEGQLSAGLTFPARRYIGEIPAGKSQTVSIPLKAGLDLPSGTATITCDFSEANGFEPDPIEITFDTRAYQPPDLVIADVGIDDASGNGMIEAGEVVTVMVRVQNLGRGAAEKAEAEVKMGENVFFAEGSTAQFDLGTLPPGAFKDLQFQLYTNRRAREIAVTMSLIERHGKYGLADAPLELPFNRPVRTIQQVVIAGTETALPEVDDASGLSIDVEREIPKGRDQRKDAVALLIANRDYMDPDIPAVTYAHRDAEFVKQYLVQTLGYREGNIFLYRDATQSNFRTALRKLKNAAKKKSDVFVYYTGHGAPDPEEKAGYFVPVDCDPNYVQLGGVGLEEFYKELGRIKARHIKVVIDACFSGASAAGMLIAEASPIFISLEDPAASLANGVILTSSSGEQISSWYPQMRHSLYTYYFLKALQGAADQDSDRQLTVVELQTYLEEQVPYMARRLHNRLQTPGVTPGRSERVLVRYE